MAEIIPLFPLGTVLFPGVVLPLHIFEPRYRALIRDLMTADTRSRQFGVCAIRQGWEVGEDAVTALYDVGCTAELRQVHPYRDGRFDVVNVGRDRFRLLEVLPSDGDVPYLRARIERLPEVTAEAPADEEAEVLAAGVREVFARCRTLLHATLRAGEDRAARDDDGHPVLPALPLPNDPSMLSYLVGSAAPLTLDDQQSLLAIDEPVSRLRRELRLLKREATMLSRLHAVPVPLAELQVVQSPN
ncbi:LON peptidase substrate-binding domain-containing protein [Cryptosporangium arvum]|uniref:LON peptidase substrate-binding domain-containing protein n=1 Tax=Cryptosporangium arvum TaxID=80871 RepID=UPI0004AC963C|nr:LON peptidase substrate-binding domain-containing protein [Cryptosporangium arvum]